SVAEQLALRPGVARFGPEPAEIRRLRANANYLNPEIGLLSNDTWRLVATYFRNITAMSLILLPLLAAALTIPWLLTAILMISPIPYTSVPLWIGMIGVAMGTAYMGINLPSGGNKRGSQRSFLVSCLLPLSVAAFAVTTYWAWFVAYGRTTPKWSFFGLIAPHQVVPFIYLGVLMHLVSWVTSLLRAHGFRLNEFLAVIFSGAILGWLFWVSATTVFSQPLATPELYTVFAAPVFLSMFYLDMLVFAIITSRWTGQEDREWWGRAAAWILSISVTWIGLSLLTLFGPLLLSRMMIWGMSTVTVGGAVGFIILLAGRFGFGSATTKSDDRIAALVSLIFNKTIAAYLF